VFEDITKLRGKILTKLIHVEYPRQTKIVIGILKKNIYLINLLIEFGM
jgi:hypothetical protein